MKRNLVVYLFLAIFFATLNLNASASTDSYDSILKLATESHAPWIDPAANKSLEGICFSASAPYKKKHGYLATYRTKAGTFKVLKMKFFILESLDQETVKKNVDQSVRDFAALTSFEIADPFYVNDAKIGYEYFYQENGYDSHTKVQITKIAKGHIGKLFDTQSGNTNPESICRF
ncbi:MAG: hypothetical protein QE271_02010 [Bacteriovoracaceae bacterium]|nr:hypothetical protein [Bacteriovoracaceae bacterium]